MTTIADFTTEKIIGSLLLHHARCEGHFRDQEPGRAWIGLVTFGYMITQELSKRLSEEDWQWYKSLFQEIGPFKPDEVNQSSGELS